MEYTYSLKNYLGIWRNVLISYFAILIVFALFTYKDADPLWSYCTLALSCLIGLKLFYHLFLKNIGFSGFGIITGAFIFKLLFSTWHFLTFVQTDYFNGNTDYIFNSEFYWMHESIAYLANAASKVGFINALTVDFFIEDKGAIIWYLYSPIYYIGGELVLNLCHVSAVFTLFTAILTTYMAKNFFNLNKNQLVATLILTSFFPFGMITSITIRDFAGQFLMAIGMISLQYAFKNTKLFVLLFISAILLFLQRKNYIVIPFITYLIFLFFYTKESGLKKFSSNFNLRILFLIATFAVTYSYFKVLLGTNLIDTDAQFNDEYTADLTSIKFYLLLPVYIFKGFLGPFPWTQFLQFKEQTIYQISDYFTSTFLFTIVLTMLKKRIKWSLIKSEVNVVSISSVIISFGGIASGYMHLSYIAISIIFLIPFVMKFMNLNYFLRNYVFVFIILFMLSLLWDVLGFYGGGTWNDFKS
jgi:hypothetical protein